MNKLQKIFYGFIGAIFALTLMVGGYLLAEQGDTATFGWDTTNNVSILRADSSNDLIPGKDDSYDLGMTGYEFKDLYIDGVAYLDQADITAGTITGITDLVVADGGTGAGTFTDGGILLGSGTGAITALAVLADGSIVVGDGTTDPVALAAFDSSTGDLTVAAGGTGVSALTDHCVFVGSGTTAVTILTVGGANEILCGAAGADPSFRALVDADVPAILTLAGSTIDSSAIGGSTPAAGAFTTLGATGDVTTSANITNTLGTGEVLAINATSDSTGAVAPFVYTSTMTGPAATGGRALFQLNANAALGGWANALKAYTVIATAGSVSGLGSALCTEMLLPGAALSTGSYGVHEIELVTQTSGTVTSPVAMQWMQVSGDDTATASWEDSGYIWIIKGLSDDPGNIFDTNTTPTCDATLRILVGDTPYYILLSNSPTS